MDSTSIKEGDNVIFKRNVSCRAFQIRKNRQVYFEKNKFSVDELIGQAYGSTFEIDRGKLVKLERKPTTLEFDMNLQDPTTDNRDLQDMDSNQKMSKEDIMKLKEKGVTGEKIIEELIENSETFKTKTEFSQAKYLKKKKSKHILSFTVLRPTPRLVLNTFAKEPQKICNLRADTLSQMLSYSNIMCGSNVAVVETCQGLVLSCILQRLGGKGKLIQLIPNSSNQVCRQVMSNFGFSKEEFDNVYSFPISVLEDLKDNHNKSLNVSYDESKDCEESNQPKRRAIEKDYGELSSEIKKAIPTPEVSDATEDIKKELPIPKVVNATDDNSNNEGNVSPTDETEGETGNDGTESKSSAPRRELQRKNRAIRHREVADLIMSKKIDSLILACKYNPAPIVKNMLEFMPPSRPVVVFCPYIEPLVDIYTYLKDKRVGLQVKLSETWLREYQILPQRTHPMMNMSGNGGYLLTFTTCDPAMTD